MIPPVYSANYSMNFHLSDYAPLLFMLPYIIQLHKHLNELLSCQSDETWANAHDGKSRAWVEDDTVTGGTKSGVRFVQ